MNRRILIPSVLALIVLSGVALAKPGEGIRVGNLAISPFLDLSVTYDDNVYLTKDNEVDDFFLDVVPGIALLNRTDRLILRGRGWGQLRYHLDETDLDHQSYGEKIGLVYGGEDNPLLQLNQKFVHLTDYEILPRNVDSLNLPGENLMLTEDRTERVERDIFDIGGLLGRNVTDKLRLDLGGAYSLVDYDTPLLFDWDEWKVGAEAQFELTDKTWALITGQYSEQDSDGFEDISHYYLVRGGFITHTTGKTWFKGSVGVEDYTAGGTSPEGESLDDQIVNFDVTAAWDATPKLNLQLSGRNGIQPATQYQSNTKEIQLVSAGFSYRMTETIRLSLAGSYREDDYVARVLFNEELRHKKREHIGGRIRIDYWPHAKFYDVYLEATYEDVTDNLEDDHENYDQFRVAAGLALRY